MSAIPALKAKLRAVAAELWPAAQTTMGPPPADSPQDLAVIEAARAEITRPTAGGAKRSREEAAEIDLVVSCYRPGDDEEQQLAASAAAWAMVDQLEDWLRIRGTETLGGLCRDAWVSEYSDRDYRLTDDQGYVIGRACDVTVTVTANTRI